MAPSKNTLQSQSLPNEKSKQGGKAEKIPRTNERQTMSLSQWEARASELGFMAEVYHLQTQESLIYGN
jgi:hypothetical protein